jgi:PAS domain S-box-containing protein
VAAESGRHYAESDLHLAQDLADRAALAIDNARLYQASVRVAAERSAILTNMADGVIITDPQGRISYVNPAACTTLGLAETELMGMELTDLVESVGLEGAKGERLMPEGSALSTALQGETVRRVERRITRRDGSEVILQVSAAPLRVEGVGFAGAVSVFRDVTPERTLEVQKDAFLSAVAHDLKNPLAGIKTLTQMLERRAGRSEDPDFAKMREGLGRIDVTTNRLTAMVNELLDVTRMQMGRPVEMDRRPVDLVELVRRVSAEHQHTTGWHPINVTVHPPQIVGHWDASRLERVVANLLSNAIKYSPGGGEIRVTIAEEVCDGTRAAVLSVDDRGMGIPEADLPFVFDRFHRGRNVAGRIPGTGIGLSGAQFIVQEHGGRIRVESREGEGTTFTVILPVEGGGPHPSVRPPGS